MRKALKLLGLIAGVSLLVLNAFMLGGCGNKEETSAASEGYYEGPMKPKSERVGAPTQSTEGQ